MSEYSKILGDENRYCVTTTSNLGSCDYLHTTGCETLLDEAGCRSLSNFPETVFMPATILFNDFNFERRSLPVCDFNAPIPTIYQGVLPQQVADRKYHKLRRKLRSITLCQ